jgi:hypothetical protein
MNELIKLLAEQAKNSIPKDSLGVTDWIEAYNQKFAELIVAECADIADKAEPYKASDLIKQHFGVELDVNETLRNRSTYFGNDI